MKTRQLLPWIFLYLRQKRWLFMILLGASIVTIEAMEHISVRESILTMHFFTESIIYGLTIPLSGAVLLSWVDRLELSRLQKELEHNKKHEFNRQLVEASTWEKLTDTILQFPMSIFPVSSIHLYLKDLENNTISWVASDGEHGIGDGNGKSRFDKCECQACHLWLGSAASVQKCSLSLDPLRANKPENYCLPLANKGEVIGILRLVLSSNKAVTLEQLSMLGDYAPEMALALENARLQIKIQHQSEAENEARRRIAQDLHDTLGQNLSYLRLKLDQISFQSPLLSIAEIQKDIDKMRDIANEAYLQMRGTLADLHPNSQIKLGDAIRAHASTVSERAKFNLEVTDHGQPVELAPHTGRQLLYICREALNNIEKHSGALAVKIDLNWGEKDLTISIADDGRGFDPENAFLKNRYGIKIMSERAADIKGNLSISSKPNQGTQVLISLSLMSVSQFNFVKS